MTKRPTKTTSGATRSVPEQAPAQTDLPAGADPRSPLPSELRSSVTRRDLTLKEAIEQTTTPEAATAVPIAPTDASASLVPVPDPDVRRSARALVPILADGALYLPGTENEMVPLTFVAYGELAAARLIDPLPWDALMLVEEGPNALKSDAI